jgi:hypothetical protein
MGIEIMKLSLYRNWHDFTIQKFDKMELTNPVSAAAVE